MVENEVDLGVIEGDPAGTLLVRTGDKGNKRAGDIGNSFLWSIEVDSKM